MAALGRFQLPVGLNLQQECQSTSSAQHPRWRGVQRISPTNRQEPSVIERFQWALPQKYDDGGYTGANMDQASSSLPKVDWLFVFARAALNLIRLPKLLATPGVRHRASVDAVESAKRSCVERSCRAIGRL